MGTKNKTNRKLLLQVLSKSITVRMTTLRILARQVYYFTKKYCLLSYVAAECPAYDLLNLVNSSELIEFSF